MAYTTINKHTAHLNTKLYTGDGTATQAITGVGFQPDWTWIKCRNVGHDHYTFDAVRTNKKGLESMFKKVTEVDDEGKLIQKEILDPFITTADEMSGAKINMNRKLANKRSLAYAIDEWNKNPTKKYYRGEKSKKYLDDAKWLEDNPEFRKSFERELNRQVEEGWGKYGKSTYDEDLKGGFFSPHSGVARGYAQGKWHELPPVKKIELKPWEVQEALERNYENNPFVGPGDILLDKATRKKANLDWYESIKAKLGLAEGGRVGMVKGYG